jgi:hypothetical protein
VPTQVTTEQEPQEGSVAAEQAPYDHRRRGGSPEEEAGVVPPALHEGWARRPKGRPPGTDVSGLVSDGWSGEAAVWPSGPDPPGLDREGAGRGTERRTGPHTMMAGSSSGNKW